MVEKIIELENIDPKIFFGANNMLVDELRNYFPKLKVIARGNEIKAMGNKDEVEIFERKLNELIDFFEKHNRIEKEDIERLFSDPEAMKSAALKGSDDALVFSTSGKPIRARTVNQFRLVDDYRVNDLLIAVGPAGTGKTYTAIALAVMALKNKQVKRIVLTRPAVEAGERLGFLPGDLKEKLDPYLQPLYDALKDMIHFRKLEAWLEDGTIQISPLAYMRGRTLEQSFVILDEAQNTTISQLKMFLTRMGVNSKFIMTGDITQIDLPEKRKSGLLQAIRILKDIEGISVIEFDERDIVRHKLVKDIVKAYDTEQEKE
ncbi:MAG: PhoH family protein [Bacteroidales bacterium]|nr:PhoH family protein [Bacteroidales bacterium]